MQQLSCIKLQQNPQTAHDQNMYEYFVAFNLSKPHYLHRILLIQLATSQCSSQRDQAPSTVTLRVPPRRTPSPVAAPCTGPTLGADIQPRLLRGPHSPSCPPLFHELQGAEVPGRAQLCNPMDCSPPGSPIHGSLQARILEWVAMLPSKGSSQPMH